jgi:hypothetical protein
MRTYTVNGCKENWILLCYILIDFLNWTQSFNKILFYKFDTNRWDRNETNHHIFVHIPHFVSLSFSIDNTIHRYSVLSLIFLTLQWRQVNLPVFHCIWNKARNRKISTDIYSIRNYGLRSFLQFPWRTLVQYLSPVKHSSCYKHHPILHLEIFNFSKCIYVFLMILRISNDYFPKQHLLIGLCNGGTMCFCDLTIGLILTSPPEDRNRAYF